MEKSIKMLMGPILGYEEGGLYTVCFLSDKTIPMTELVIAGKAVVFTKVTDTPSGIFWRAEVRINAETAGTHHIYSIKSSGSELQDKFGRISWSFYVPGIAESPKLAFATCNGFSSAKLARDEVEPYALWRKMQEEHQQKPYSLLLMGGDQIYADQLWESSSAPSIEKWSHLSRAKQLAYPAGPKIQRELDVFYEHIYIKNWDINTDMAWMLASVPSVMMWDDHDIFDGWGSYPKELLNCPVYQAIFQTAKKYFGLNQLRTQSNKNLLTHTGEHFTWGVRFREYLILALDNRSNRTQTQLMSDAQWHDVKNWLSNHQQSTDIVDNFLVITGLPLVYRSFANIDAMLQMTPMQEELEDDVHDHWTVKAHEGERMKLVKNLLSFTKAKNCKTVVLSGDVHIGSVGLIKDKIEQLEITQIISSGVVHPAPTLFEWLGIQATSSDDKEFLGKGDITTEIIKPFGADKYILGRNYSTLEKGTDGKLWVNWICEKNIKPCYPI